MKKIGILLSVLFVAIAMNAQPPQGGRGGRPGGPPPGGMRPGGASMENQLTLEHFPEIPNLTLKQRERIGSILGQEQKDVMSQMDKKKEIMTTRKENQSEKDREKERKKIEKIDKKITDIKTKSDKKIKKELSDEQYNVFLAKREEFKFKHQRGNRPRPNIDSGNRPQRPPFEQDGKDSMFE